MEKVVNITDAVDISKKLHEQNKVIVLVGGCFDILHVGHIEFFKEAKKQGDCLIILLESDESIKKIKGKNRPINAQEDRAKVLEALNEVDYVVNLPPLETNNKYDDLIFKIKPSIIATTKGDPHRAHKERQAKMINGKVVDVIDRISKESTSDLAKKILEDIYL